MANILPVHQMIDRPDFLGTAQQGLQFGNQQRALREQRADEAQLRQLAPQIMAGDVGALEQAAVIDPARAGKFKAAGDVKWQTLKGGYDLVKRAQATGNPQAVQQAWAAYRPWIQKVTGTAPPEDFATAAPHFDQLGMRLAMIEGSGGDQKMFAQKIGADGYIYNAMADGTMVNTGIKADRQMWLRDHPGMTPELVGKDGTARPVGTATGGMPEGPSVQQYSDVIAAAAEAMTRAGVPDDTVSAWVVQQTQGREDGPATGAPPTLAQARPSEAQVAFDKEAAQQSAQIAALPTRGQIEAQNAGLATGAKVGAELAYAPQQAAAAGATEEAKQNAQTRAELTQLLPKVQSESQRTVALIDRALNHPGREAATGLSSALDPRNFVRGTDATNFRILLDQLKGGTFLQAFQSLKGGGAITQVEGQKAEQAIARLSEAQSDAEFMVALKDLRDVAASLPTSIQQKLRAAEQSAARSGPQIGEVQDGYRYRGGNPADPNSWERL